MTIECTHTVLIGRRPRARIIRWAVGVAAMALTALASFPMGLAQAQTAADIPVTVDVAIVNERLVEIFATADATKPSVKLDAYENFSRRLVFRVISKTGDRLKVWLPIRPNGVTGYINSADAKVKTYDYAILVDLSDRKLTLYRAGVPVFADKVAIGAPKTPTPLGQYYLTELAKVSNKGSEYGTYAFGLSAFSETITRFKSRSGQIGLHGTNKPKDLGKNISHGCIRLNNASIAKLAKTVPQGTPIIIVP
jgi:lipoprotein-anchoring transpeptidase ErfK/SrfK